LRDGDLRQKPFAFHASKDRKPDNQRQLREVKAGKDDQELNPLLIDLKISGWPSDRLP
jgi:hypothetical protein